VKALNRTGGVLRPTAWLIRHADLYDPEPRGLCDVLVVGERVVAVAPHLPPPRLGPDADVAVVDLRGARLVPGFVDMHVHLAGGGGEGGFLHRTPAVPPSALAAAGTTTAVGLLGTDGVTRSVQELLATVRAVNDAGLTAYMYTGAYEIPTRTITGSVRADIVLIDRVLGTGEIAVSDDRSSHPSEDDLAHLAAETRVGGLLSGKAGVLHLHMGAGRRGLEPVLDLLSRRDLPAAMFVPTHLNRNERLLDQAVALAKLGGGVDLTAGLDRPAGDSAEIPAPRALRRLLEAGVALERITLSSDAGGSLPVFGPAGELAGIDVGRPRTLWLAARAAVIDEGLDLATALATVTANPARRLRLAAKGRVAAGADADLVSLDGQLRVDRVWARGALVARGGRALLRGPFEGAFA
jgi:beta-aspartyl-dipeptidase (metallo-type)